MYQAERWDAERRLLWIKTTPNGDWMPATMQQTIDYLAERVALSESRASEPATPAFNPEFFRLVQAADHAARYDEHGRPVD